MFSPTTSRSHQRRAPVPAGAHGPGCSRSKQPLVKPTRQPRRRQRSTCSTRRGAATSPCAARRARASAPPAGRSRAPRRCRPCPPRCRPRCWPAARRPAARAPPASPAASDRDHRVAGAGDVVHLRRPRPGNGGRASPSSSVMPSSLRVTSTAPKPCACAQRARGGDDRRLGVHRHAGRLGQFGAVRRDQVGAGIARVVARPSGPPPRGARRPARGGDQALRGGAVQHALAVVGQHHHGGRGHRVAGDARPCGPRGADGSALRPLLVGAQQLLAGGDEAGLGRGVRARPAPAARARRPAGRRSARSGRCPPGRRPPPRRRRRPRRARSGCAPRCPRRRASRPRAPPPARAPAPRG